MTRAPQRTLREVNEELARWDRECAKDAPKEQVIKGFLNHDETRIAISRFTKNDEGIVRIRQNSGDWIDIPFEMFDEFITALRDTKVDILVDMLYGGKVPDDLSQEDKREILGLLNFQAIVQEQKRKQHVQNEK